MNIYGLRAVVLFVLLDWGATDSVEYTGCFIKADSYDSDSRWQKFDFSDGDVYQKCTEKLHEIGWKLFALHVDGGCYGSSDIGSLWHDSTIKRHEGCQEDGNTDRYLGDVDNTMAVYQLVVHQSSTFEMYMQNQAELSCNDDSTIKIYSARASCPGQDVDETGPIRAYCYGKSECEFNFKNDDYDGLDVNIDTAQCQEILVLRITYGCVLNPADEENHDEGRAWYWYLVDQIRWIAFVVAIVIIIIYYKKNKDRMMQDPATRAKLWAVHKACPCFGIFPSDAEECNPATQANQNVAVATGPGALPPVVSDQPIPPPYDAPYPPPDTSYPPPAYPPATASDDLPLPPTYTEVTTSRTSGGWFSKMAR